MVKYNITFDTLVNYSPSSILIKTLALIMQCARGWKRKRERGVKREVTINMTDGCSIIENLSLHAVSSWLHKSIKMIPLSCSHFTLTISSPLESKPWHPLKPSHSAGHTHTRKPAIHTGQKINYSLVTNALSRMEVHDFTVGQEVK